MKLYGVNPDHVDQMFSTVAPLLAKAVDRSLGRHTLESVHVACRKTAMQLWVAMPEDHSGIVGAFVTEIKVGHGIKICNILFGGGKGLLEHQAALYAECERWAKAMGCDCAQSYVRRGLLKNYKKIGFQVVAKRPEGYLIHKEIDKEVDGNSKKHIYH